MPDGDHGRIILWLTRICMQHRPEFWLHPGQGIKAERYREGRAIPDGFWRTRTRSWGRATGWIRARS